MPLKTPLYPEPHCFHTPPFSTASGVFWTQQLYLPIRVMTPYCRRMVCVDIVLTIL